MKYSILFLLLFVSVILSQPQKMSAVNDQIILADYKIITDTTESLYYSFAIRNDFLLFTKNNDAYRAEYKVELEIIPDDDSQIQRYMFSETVSEKNYSGTISKKFREGLIKVNSIPKKFIARPVFTDLFSNRETRLQLIRYNADSAKASFFITDGKDRSGNARESFRLINRGRYIPFIPEDVNLIIPLNVMNKSKIKAEIISSRGSKVLNPEELLVKEISVSYDSNGLYLSCPKGETKKLLVFSGINRQLPEGEFTIKLSSDKDTAFFRTNLRVFWFDKPATLRDTEFAVKLIKIIDGSSKQDSIRREVDEENQKPLFDYWKTFDPTPLTEYNELMTEFYRRADEANNRFSTIRGNDGVLTDRGKIFVKFGEPEMVERGSALTGRMSEIWYYGKNERKFIFVDRSGTGNYELK